MLTIEMLKPRDGICATCRGDGIVIPRLEEITPPTMLQMAPFGDGFKRELFYSEHDVDLAFVYCDSLYQGPDDITFRCPVSAVKPAGSLQRQLGRWFGSTRSERQWASRLVRREVKAVSSHRTPQKLAPLCCEAI